MEYIYSLWNWGAACNDCTAVLDEAPVDRVEIVRRDSVPPCPDASLLYESVICERDPLHQVVVRAGVTVDGARILQEHGSYEEYRKRLVWQMVKRKWFSALTDHTTSAFADIEPAAFVKFVAHVNETLDKAITAVVSAEIRLYFLTDPAILSLGVSPSSEVSMRSIRNWYQT